MLASVSSVLYITDTSIFKLSHVSFELDYDWQSFHFRKASVTVPAVESLNMPMTAVVAWLCPAD